MVSTTGRYVAFVSWATNLVPEGGDGIGNVFVRDMITGAVERVSVMASGDGAPDDCLGNSITGDGRFVSFQTFGWGLVPAGNPGVYVHDRVTGVTSQESVYPWGAGLDEIGHGSQLTDDGRWIVFDSKRNLVVPGDSDFDWDVFVRDRQLGVNELVSVSLPGEPPDAPATLGSNQFLSADGRYVVCDQGGNNIPGDTTGDHVWLRDRQAQTVQQLDLTPQGTQGDGYAYGAAISANGRFVAFASTSTNLLPGGSTSHLQLFVRDLQTGEIEVASVGTLGETNIGYVADASISDDGRWVAFASNTELFWPNNETQWEVYQRDRLTGLTHLVSIDPAGDTLGHEARMGTMSRDGRALGFHHGSDLLPQDVNPGFDTYLYDRFEAAPWKDLGGGLDGSSGVPVLAADGFLKAGVPSFLALAQALPGTAATLVVGLSSASLSFKGGILVPSPDVLLPMSTGSGKLLVPIVLSQGVPSDVPLFLQFWILDAGGIKGLAASNGLQVATP
ncbi:MAG TPA: hypothetical protein VFY71_19070 [Planctomycetota bacterium]|nr:hypothetical protein [Planctomycetota bacterium]